MTSQTELAFARAHRERMDRFFPISHPEPEPEPEPDRQLERPRPAPVAKPKIVAPIELIEAYRHARQRPSVHQVIAFVLIRMPGVTAAQIVSNCRLKSITERRSIIMHLAHRLTGQSFPQIARTLNRDHTTVLHGYWKVAERREIGRAHV